jgi:serine/threonine protein kinase
MQTHLPRHYTLDRRYYIGRVLGQGGFGVTYIAWDLKLNRYVAIKEYLPGDQCSRLIDRTTIQPHGGEKRTLFEHGLSGFLSEATLLARFSQHPCIVTVLDHIEANGTAYLVMDYLKGRTLKDYLASQGGRIPWSSAISIMTQVMDALREVHAQGALHRDVAPDNIFITDQPQAVLIDFGAARQVIGEHSKNLTAVLKPGIAPFEQYSSNAEQGPWTDVYAVAATLYRCVTGQFPPQAVDRLANDELEPPSKYCPGLAPNVDAAICKSLAVRAKDRYLSIQEFQGALAAAPPPPPHPLPEKEKRAEDANKGTHFEWEGGGQEESKTDWQWAWLFGGLVVIVIIGIIISAVSHQQEQERQRESAAREEQYQHERQAAREQEQAALYKSYLPGQWREDTEYDGTFTNVPDRFHVKEARNLQIQAYGDGFRAVWTETRRYRYLAGTGSFIREFQGTFTIHLNGSELIVVTESARTRDDSEPWTYLNNMEFGGTISESALSYHIEWKNGEKVVGAGYGTFHR